MILGFLGWRRRKAMPKPEYRRAIETLHEARRYIKTKPELAAYMIADSMTSVADVANQKIDRLAANLDVAIKYIQVEPDVARAYVDAAAFELQCVEEKWQS
jgi:hypothetical protein